MTIDDMIQHFQRARKWIQCGWCRENMAQDAFGRPVAPLAPEARNWCIMGALIKAAVHRSSENRHKLYDALRKANGISSISAWNDNTSQEEVLAGIDQTIDYLRDIENDETNDPRDT